ncbi:hypothetical protein VEZ01S_14_00040 [Vibrio ezurae NBRC 102218]|uniref:Uncharacterized protein n=1 Tax=Vibrio ezurae NBRC 102218 TaxID=1219080 RepID=U3AHP5_9VIBR|nr:hypothetical protein VEZ01S_14_00040 [Vibrio ezurae NBRC 102218]
MSGVYGKKESLVSMLKPVADNIRIVLRSYGLCLYTKSFSRFWLLGSNNANITYKS